MKVIMLTLGQVATWRICEVRAMKELGILAMWVSGFLIGYAIAQYRFRDYSKH